MLDAFFNRNTELDIFPIAVTDCAGIAGLHGTRFAHAWNDGAFHSLLSQNSVYGFVAKQAGAPPVARPGGFVLARETAGEAEILTIAVDLKLARQSLGWRLMLAAMREARERGAESLFLEVDQANQAAIGLYSKLGFSKVGERKSYYTDAAGQKSSALVMRRDLR